MRVLHIGKYYPPFSGGMEAFTGDLCLALSEAGHQPFVLAHAHRGAAAGRSHEGPVPVHRAGVCAELVFTPISVSFPLILDRCLRDFRPDVLHFHLPNPSAFWALLLPRARRLPWVVHWHSDVVTSTQQRGLRLTYPFYRPWEQALLRRAARVIVTSPPYLETSVPLMPHRDRCTVIPLGLDRRRLAPTGDRTAPWPAGHLRLLAIGRLTYYKGFSTLLRAVADIPKAALVIAGRGRELETIKRDIQTHQLHHRVQLLHDVGDEQRDHLLRQCDIFCLPSIERTEAFGLVLLEAMAFGRPLVVSDIPGSGAPWLVREAHCGRLARPGDVDDLQRMIQVLAEDPGMRARMGTAGREAFENRFEIHPVAAAVAEVYREVCALPPSRRRPARTLHRNGS